MSNRNIAATGLGCSFGQQRLPLEATDCSVLGPFLTAGKILFTGRTTCSLYLVL